MPGLRSDGGATREGDASKAAPEASEKMELAGRPELAQRRVR